MNGYKSLTVRSFNFDNPQGPDIIQNYTIYGLIQLGEIEVTEN